MSLYCGVFRNIECPRHFFEHNSVDLSYLVVLILSLRFRDFCYTGYGMLRRYEILVNKYFAFTVTFAPCNLQQFLVLVHVTTVCVCFTS